MVGIVILNYNDYSTVMRLYNTIKDYKTIHHIVIVDNCSTDGSYERLKSDCSCVVLRTAQNGGYSYGNNYGIQWLQRNTACDYYIVSNPDVIFEEKFVREIIREMENNPSIGIMSGVMLDREHNPARSQFGYTTKFGKSLLECFYLYRRYQMRYAKHRVDTTKKINYVEVVWGSLFVISDDAYRAINGFDENTFLYHEENIISEKMKANHYKEAILTTVEYVHMHAVSISKGTSRMSRHKIGAESMYYFQCTYHHLNKFQKSILRCMLNYSILELYLINSVLNIFGK